MAAEKLLPAGSGDGIRKCMNSTLAGYGLVALGGALGAMARMGVGQWVRTVAQGPVPWHTFVINVGGSFALGVVVSVLAARGQEHTAVLNHLLAIGFLGAFTTFSTFELETWNLVTEGKWVVALLYVMASVVSGCGGLGLGVLAGRLL